MTEAPAELWVSPGEAEDGLDGLYLEDDATGRGAVRYVRADLYEAALALAERRVEAVLVRLAVVRSWGDAPCLEPLGTDYPR